MPMGSAAMSKKCLLALSLAALGDVFNERNHWAGGSDWLQASANKPPKYRNSARKSSVAKERRAARRRKAKK